MSASTDAQIAEDFGGVAQPGQRNTLNIYQVDQAPGLCVLAAANVAEESLQRDNFMVDSAINGFLDSLVGLGGEDEILFPSGLTSRVAHVCKVPFMDNGDAEIFLQVKTL